MGDYDTGSGSEFTSQAKQEFLPASRKKKSVKHLLTAMCVRPQNSSYVYFERHTNPLCNIFSKPSSGQIRLGDKISPSNTPPVHSDWELTTRSKYLAEKRSRFYLSCQILHLDNTFYIPLPVYWTVQQNAISLVPDNHLRPLFNHDLYVLLLPTTSCLQFFLHP